MTTTHLVDSSKTCNYMIDGYPKRWVKDESTTLYYVSTLCINFKLYQASTRQRHTTIVSFSRHPPPATTAAATPTPTSTPIAVAITATCHVTTISPPTMRLVKSCRPSRQLATNTTWTSPTPRRPTRPHTKSSTTTTTTATTIIWISTPVAFSAWPQHRRRSSHSTVSIYLLHSTMSWKATTTSTTTTKTVWTTQATRARCSGGHRLSPRCHNTATYTRHRLFRLWQVHYKQQQHHFEWRMSHYLLSSTTVLTNKQKQKAVALAAQILIRPRQQPLRRLP